MVIKSSLPATVDQRSARDAEPVAAMPGRRLTVNRRYLLTAAAALLALRAGAADPGARLEPGKHAAGASGRNEAVDLSVRGFTVARSLGGATAGEGKVLVSVKTAWKNIIPLKKALKNPEQGQDRTMGAGSLGFGGGAAPQRHKESDYVMAPTPYVVPAVPDHLFLVVDGGTAVKISPAQAEAPGALSVEEIAIPKLGAVLEGVFVFEVRQQVRSLELMFLDTAYGNVRLPLHGRAPAPERPKLGPVGNEVVDLGAFGLQEVKQLGAVTAPAGKRFAVVELQLRGKSEKDLVRFVLEDRATLYDAQHRYSVAREAPAPGALGGELQLVPFTAARGTLAFAVDEGHGPLGLAVDLPGQAPLRLALAAGAPGEPPKARAPRGLFTFKDGETLLVTVQAARTASALKEARPEPGKRFLVLELTLTSQAGDGIEFQTGEQLKLLAGEEEIRVDAEALPRLARPLLENSVIPPGGSLPFEVVYQVPAASRQLVLYYRGFHGEEKHALEVR